MKSFAKWIVVFAIPFSAASGQQSGTAEADAAMQNVREWATLEANWGVPSRQPIPNSALELVEKQREKAAGGRTIFHYNFKVIGLPTDDTYQMEYWPVGGASHPFQKIATELHISSSGMIVCGPKQACGDKHQPEYPLETAVPRTGLGEPHRFVLTSEQHPKIWVTGLAIPFPVRSTSGPCQLEYVRVTPNGGLLLLKGAGFPANQEITLTGSSHGEQHTTTAHTDSAGSFLKVELPFVVGKDSGEIKDLVTQGTDCHPSISTKWGSANREIQ